MCLRRVIVLLHLQRQYTLSKGMSLAFDYLTNMRWKHGQPKDIYLPGGHISVSLFQLGTQPVPPARWESEPVDNDPNLVLEDAANNDAPAEDKEELEEGEIKDDPKPTRKRSKQIFCFCFHSYTYVRICSECRILGGQGTSADGKRGKHTVMLSDSDSSSDGEQRG